MTAQRRARRRLGLGGGILLLVVLAIASLAIGSKDIPFDQIWPALLDPTGSDTALIVTGLRVPRTVLGVLVGAALGVAGALIQAFTRNPLADPGVLGVNAGAALGVSVSIVFLGLEGIGQLVWPALIGAVVATVGVYAVGRSGRSGATPIRMTLAGVGIGAVLAGITSAISLSNPQRFHSMLGWSAGTLVGPPLSTSGVIAPLVGVGLVVALGISRDLNALGLGEDLASSLGSRVVVTRSLAVLAVTLLAGAATAAAGPIGFIGLMVPHVARWITGPDQRWIMAYSVVLGPCVLLLSDIVGRIVMRPAELPVGIVTAFVGAPILISLARRSKASAL